MKRIQLLIILAILSFTVVAQDRIDRRVVYLWDVTYSMHGGYYGTSNGTVTIAGKKHTITKYREKYDIYTPIMNKLIADINNQNARTEIVVIPFGSEVLDCWRRMGTTEGKRTIIDNISNFCELSREKVQATSISGALEYIQHNIFTAECPNTLKLMTDGMENVDKEKYYYILDNWCEFAGEKNIQGYYFILSQEAINSHLQSRLEKTCFTIIVDDPTTEDFSTPDCLVQIQESAIISSVNDYNKPINLTISFTEGHLTKNTDVRFLIENNPYVSLDQIVPISPECTKIELTPTFTMSQIQAREALPHETTLKVFATVESEDSNLKLEKSEHSLIIQNRPIKKMTISIKQ